MPINTFRMWFLALGLSCFGAVLSQIFVRIYFAFPSIESFLICRPTVLPSANDHRQPAVPSGVPRNYCFISTGVNADAGLQIIGYILGKALDQVIPGPGETARIKTRSNWFTRSALSRSSLFFFILTIVTRFMNPGPFSAFI